MRSGEGAGASLGSWSLLFLSWLWERLQPRWGRPAAPSRLKALPRNTQRGFTYIGLLLLVALLGAGLGTAAQVWTTRVHREAEREQIWRGHAIAEALKRYRQAPVQPGAASGAAAAVRPGARRLEDLLEDRRGVGTLRHLRQLYADPCTGRPDWQLERDEQGAIVALRSRCARPALLREGLDDSADRPRLRDRRFTAGGAAPAASEGHAPTVTPP